MSVKLSAYVWDGCALSGMKLTEVVIMARLADWCNDEGVCWPSVGTIARQIGAGESTVRTAISKLQKEGWLSRRQRRQGNRNASNVYHLNVAKLREAANKVHAPESDTSKPDASKSDSSKSEASNSDPSNNCRETGFDPSASGGDPLVNSKQDPSDKNTSVQPPSAAGRDDKISEEIHLTDQAILVLKHLNQVTGAKYTTAKATLENIRARLVDGHTVDELKTVVEYMSDRWLGTEWSKHLTPPTIFHLAKFPANLLGAQAWEKSGRAAVAQRAEAVNTVERDDAFKRLVANPGKPRNRIEELAKRAAGKAGLGRINESIARNSWKSIWTEAVKNAAEENQQESA
ncbi:helix-turn-helix domain-containing protein [Erwinia persicina]|uniref:conserved phage C-terminal domain-containing protein n=1 Tax=Erwinia persicina TaxID=55211 RepID=UPI0021083E57|nr:conserved phage C-terminal domain-containing protein [Erwinia persicina]MCQ4105188.1 helix-turn-helix domain-containing protein [Erwinia persicina]UTX11400.1 helix-turn-helix domain-containing protein [Erwinia persicina]